MSAFPLSGTVELTCMLCLRVTLQPCITSLSTTSPTRSVRAKSSMTDKVQVSLFYSDSFLMCFKAGDILKRHMHGINLTINQFIILLYLPSSVNKLEVRHIFHSMFESWISLAEIWRKMSIFSNLCDVTIPFSQWWLLNPSVWFVWQEHNLFCCFDIIRSTKSQIFLQICRQNGC